MNSPAPSSPNSASKAFLIAAVVLGVLATVLAFSFINSSASADRGPHRKIVTAKHDLRPNATIDPDRDLQIEEVPEKFASLADQCLNANALSNYKGQRVNRRIQASQPIFLADLAAVGDLSLGEGMRALTIPAETGVIIPGDFVKVIISRPDTAAAAAPDPSRAPYQVALIGKNNGYRVLAVGGSLSKTRQQVTAAEQYESGANARTVTLEVSEDQAGEVMRAMGSGQQKASLLLCIPKESVPPATQP